MPPPTPSWMHPSTSTSFSSHCMCLAPTSCLFYNSTSSYSVDLCALQLTLSAIGMGYCMHTYNTRSFITVLVFITTLYHASCKSYRNRRILWLPKYKIMSIRQYVPPHVAIYVGSAHCMSFHSHCAATIHCTGIPKHIDRD